MGCDNSVDVMEKDLTDIEQEVDRRQNPLKYRQMTEEALARGESDPVLPLRKGEGDRGKKLSKASSSAIVKLMTGQDHTLPKRVGVTSGQDAAEHLLVVRGKYDIPVGMLPKLMELQNYDLLEFIVDDSASMDELTDVKDPTCARCFTRWEEVRYRLERMFDILSAVPTPPIRVSFLNSEFKILLREGGVSSSPEAFHEEVHREFNRVWKHKPLGTTPALVALEASLWEHRDDNVCRYFFGDGEPNGKAKEENAIAKMLQERKNPGMNPFTFLSCTDQLEQKQWMKDIQEVTPYCGNYDDYESQKKEVAKNQGDAFLYTRGLHLVAQLVGTINPFELDCLDQSIPMTKSSLDGCVGTQHTDLEYRQYFDSFLAAQERREEKSDVDKVRKQQDWNNSFEDFKKQEVASKVAAVGDYHHKLKAANGGKSTRSAW